MNHRIRPIREAADLRELRRRTQSIRSIKYLRVRERVPVVAIADAVIEPLAVVVEAFNAALTLAAVFGGNRGIGLARTAELLRRRGVEFRSGLAGESDERVGGVELSGDNCKEKHEDLNDSD